MTNRSFAKDGSTPRQALRLALLHMATAEGIPHQVIAAALDLSPSHFSRAITLYPSEESHQRANFPADITADYMIHGKNQSYLMTLVDLMGYNSSRLEEIRRQVKTREQLLEEIADRLGTRQKEDEALREQFRLVAEEAGEKKGRKR